MFLINLYLLCVEKCSEFSPRVMGDHGESCLRELVVDRVVDGTQVYVVVQQLAVHGQQQCDGVRLVLHSGQVQSSVLDTNTWCYQLRTPLQRNFQSRLFRNVILPLHISYISDPMAQLR